MKKLAKYDCILNALSTIYKLIIFIQALLSIFHETRCIYLNKRNLIIVKMSLNYITFALKKKNEIFSQGIFVYT